MGNNFGRPERGRDLSLARTRPAKVEAFETWMMITARPPNCRVPRSKPTRSPPTVCALIFRGLPQRRAGGAAS